MQVSRGLISRIINKRDTLSASAIRRSIS